MFAEIRFWEFPLSLIAACAFVLAVILCGLNLGKSAFLRFLCGKKSTVTLLAVCVAMMAAEGVWSIGIHHKWWFLLTATVLAFSMGMITVDGIRKRKPVSFILCHAGFFLLVSGAFFGAPDFRDSMIPVGRQDAVNVAFDTEGKPVLLPFQLKLKEFHIDYYEDGVSPKQYSSIIDIDGVTMVTSVNHPLRYKGYDIYQFDYEHESGSYSVLKLVRDPWIGLVYAGMLLMAAGALAGLGKTWRSRWAVLIALALAVVFGFISLARINFGTLMPALRSLWFIPHLVIYMLAYSSLALSVALALVSLVGKKGRAADLSRSLLETSSALLLLGMLCGAVWAKAAWGDWWTWDGKECWAAVTWLLTLTGTHISQKGRGKSGLVAFLAFIAMQFAWYGVNYLPSSDKSLHTYNQNTEIRDSGEH